MKKLVITLDTDKKVELSSPQVVYWGQIKVRIAFPAFAVEREFEVDLEVLTTWKQANPGKTWKDFLIEKLLPLYNRLEKADAVRKKIEAVLE